MIQLYLVRHATAVEGGGSTPDALRPLTTKARKRFHKIARALTRRGAKLDTILTSPLVRAVQTAEILAGEVRYGELAVLAELAPGHTAEALLRAVAARSGKRGSLALVGHGPQLSSVVAALAHLSARQSSSLDLKSGAVVRIDVSDLPAAKTAEPKWWIKPRSGARKKGLPLQEPAAKKRAGAAVRKRRAKAPLPRKPAAKKKSEPRPTAAAAPKRAAAPKPISAPQTPQKFMGTPRPVAPPAVAPAQAADPALPPRPGETKPQPN
jgi:phosphohistidine phosphatase